MKVLITGGAGFIGSAVAEETLNRGDEVCIIDDLNDYYPVLWKLDNIDTLLSKHAFSFYPVDICNEQEVLRIFERHRPDAVIHLAARAGVRPSVKDPLLYEKVNVRGTVILLEAARHHGVRKFVFASSSSVYGENAGAAVRETDCLHAPVSPYAATKLAGEEMCYSYSHLFGLSTVCLRFFSVYGPRQRPDLALRKFADLIRRGGRIPIYGDGSTARDYTYVGDIVKGILSAVDYDTSFDVFNLGNSHPIQLMSLVQELSKALGVRAEICYSPKQAGDVDFTCADISKAKRLLGYRPQTSFEEGVRHFADWYRSKMEPPEPRLKGITLPAPEMLTNVAARHAG